MGVNVVNLKKASNIKVRPHTTIVPLSGDYIFDFSALATEIESTMTIAGSGGGVNVDLSNITLHNDNGSVFMGSSYGYIDISAISLNTDFEMIVNFYGGCNLLDHNGLMFLVNDDLILEPSPRYAIYLTGKTGNMMVQTGAVSSGGLTDGKYVRLLNDVVDDLTTVRYVKTGSNVDLHINDELIGTISGVDDFSGSALYLGNNSGYKSTELKVSSIILKNL